MLDFQLPGQHGHGSKCSKLCFRRLCGFLLEAQGASRFLWSRALSADVSASSLYTPPERSNSIRPPVVSLKIVPLGLQNTMMLPLSATCPTDLIEFCRPVVLGAMWKPPERMKICVLLVVLHRFPVADLSSTPTPLGLPPKLSDRVCLHTTGAAPETIRNSFSVCFTIRHRVLAAALQPSGWNENSTPVIKDSGWLAVLHVAPRCGVSYPVLVGFHPPAVPLHVTPGLTRKA